jgi:flagellar hook-length control protein FliK
MRWEIEEDGARREQEDNTTAAKWQTRLRLTLPHLGEVDAQIRLQGTQISLALTAGNTKTQALLRTSTEALRSQFGDAGLALASVGVGAAKESQAYGQAEA